MTTFRQRVSFRLKAFKSRARGLLLKTLGAKAMGVFVQAPWGLMLVDPRDGHISRQFLRHGIYNPEEIALLESLTKPSDRVLLVGGHIGGLAIPLSKSVRSIDVVEASPVNYQLLVANVALAGTLNIACHHWAASEGEGQLKFLVSSENSGGSKRSPAYLKEQYQYDKPECITVPSYALDNKFLNQFEIILMDIEGSEFSAMKGGENLISNCRMFIFEFIPDHIRNVAGITLTEFLDIIPIESFTKFILPRQGGEFPISELRGELSKIFRIDDYEDGVILLR
jgi:FkbM family methyltransferase